MAGSIFLIRRGELVRMDETTYDSEDLLQAELALHPELLAGDQIDEVAPRNWLLIRREMGVPGDELSGGRWSLDHLFIDQDAVPTLVEVKRSSDTRIRREVVGQMLDYAANATSYWSLEVIRAQLEERCRREGKHAEQALSEFLGSETDMEEFWQRVADNLRLGRVRLLFVADRIPKELLRIVEFLNSQMTRAEVLAVEIRQYAGGEHRTLVPRVLGQTAEAAETKKPGRAKRDRPWTRRSFLDRLASNEQHEDHRIAEAILDWGEQAGLEVVGGWGATKAGLYLVSSADPEVRPFALYEGSGAAVVHLQFFAMGKLDKDAGFRAQACERLNTLDGVSLELDRPYPGIQLRLLADDGAREIFFDTLDWIVERLEG